MNDIDWDKLEKDDPYDFEADMRQAMSIIAETARLAMEQYLKNIKVEVFDVGPYAATYRFTASTETIGIVQRNMIVDCNKLLNTHNAGWIMQEIADDIAKSFGKYIYTTGDESVFAPLSKRV